jgi:colicin import membrane protein
VKTGSERSVQVDDGVRPPESGVSMPTPSKAPPVPPPQSVNRSALAATSRVGLSGSLALAALLHGLVLAAALVLPRLFPGEPKLRRPIIAHMVALGKPRDQKLLPRMEEPPPPPTAAQVHPASAPPQIDPSTKAPSVPERTTPKTSAPAKRPPTRAELMARALAGVTSDARRTRDRTPDPERAGAADGSPIGSAASAEIGEKYYGEIYEIIHANYVVPSVVSERERLFLKASMVIWIGRDGRILRHKLEKPSGNRFFDDALETALAQSKLPPPPPELAHDLGSEGVVLNFNP